MRTTKYAPNPSDVWFAADADYLAQFSRSSSPRTGDAGYRGCKRGQMFTVRVLGRLIFPAAFMNRPEVTR